MKVVLAKKMGFCFGVEHAISTAEKMLEEDKVVYCLGHLIHNNEVVDRLSGNGLRVVNNLQEVVDREKELASSGQTTDPSSVNVLIRSHGCRPELLDEVRKLGFNLVDATCVLVQRVQNLVRDLFEQGYQVVVVGDPNHPEVQGVVGYAPEVTVVAGVKDLEKAPARGKIAIVSQTTHSADDFGQVVGDLAKRGYEEIKVVNTICKETARRQASAVELCHEVDVMFVLGSRHSANTGELAELCRRHDVDTYHLQGWKEFKPEYIENKKIAGITAGASTPDWIIREFIDNLENQ